MSKLPYRVGVVTLSIIIGLAIVFFNFLSYQKIGDIYHSEIEKTILNIKKSFLKNTVDNLVHEIDLARQAETEYYARIVNRRYDALTYDTHLSDEEFVNFFVRRFVFDPDIDLGLDFWTVFLWSKPDNTVVYDPLGAYEQDIATTLARLELELSHYRIIEHGDYAGLIGVSKEYIDDLTKAKLADKVRDLRFDHDSYVWINGVLDYGGGPNYAVRVVHPNLPETEGMYLSTEMTDIQGNFPYLVELEGVKENGELFFTYYFKRLESDEEAEKLTYARLYPDYDWIIAMGIHLDDVQEYIDQTDQKSRALAGRLTARLVVSLLVVVAFTLGLLMLLERLRFRQARKRMELEIGRDALTEAASRKFGTDHLPTVFETFRSSKVSPAIMMIDVDNFKNVNDVYGHEVGDRVLKEIVQAIYQTMDCSHQLIRWGGDEFVGILHGVGKAEAEQFGRKICDAISALPITVGDRRITLTLSIGISYFRESDRSYLEVLRRADVAMYKSKAGGKNTVNTLL
jgi:diguanylate cyclase (GGDEF)-like protein